MAKYHINNQGEAGRCGATRGKCPFGGAETHHDSLADARLAYEHGQKHEAAFSPLRGNDLSLEGQEELFALQRRWELLGYELSAAAREEAAAELDLAATQTYAKKPHGRVELRKAEDLTAQARKTLEAAQASRARWVKEQASVDEEALALQARAKDRSWTSGELSWVDSEVVVATERLAAKEASAASSLARIREIHTAGNEPNKILIAALDIAQREHAAAAARLNGLTAQQARLQMESAVAAPAQTLKAPLVGSLARRATSHNSGETVAQVRALPEGSVELRMSSWPRAKEAEVEFKKAGWVTEYTGDRNGGELIRVHDPANPSVVLRQAKDFMWSPDSSSFVGEASEFGGPLRESFLLVSQKDGSAVRVHLSETERDNEGDYRSWTYRPQDGNQKWDITIFND